MRNINLIFTLHLCNCNVPSVVQIKLKKPVSLLNNFRFAPDNIVSSTVYWKCEECSCCRHVIQQGSKLPSLKKQHNHDGNEVKSKIKEIKMN